MINQAGVDLIKKYEGLKLKSYLCPAGVPTIGYGTIATAAGPVKLGMSCTEKDAITWLESEIGKKEAAVKKLTKIPLTDNMLAALVSFAYNLGVGALEKSTLLKVLNSGDINKAADEFLKWNKAKMNGVYVALPGLTARRKEERALFLL
jgi:lysozyme